MRLLEMLNRQLAKDSHLSVYLESGSERADGRSVLHGLANRFACVRCLCMPHFIVDIMGNLNTL